MAMSAKVGNFAQPTAVNASFPVTGVGFVPKAIVLLATDETGIGVSTNWVGYAGMATSTTNRAAISTIQLTATNTAQRSMDDTKVLKIVNTVGTTLVAADLVSLDADGFTLNFSTVDLVARIVGYIALGGSDLTNVFVKTFKPTGNSNTAQTFTGVGFKPDAAFHIGSSQGTVPPSTDGGSSELDFGFWTAALSKIATATPNAATQSIQNSNALDRQGGSEVATLTSFDSDGFTLTFTASTSVKYHAALCLKGGQYKVGVFNQATGTGNQSVTGVGFTPAGLLVASINRVSQSTVYTTSSRISFGAASSSTARFSIWSGGGNAGVQDNDTDTGKIINMITEGATPTTNAAADFVSNDSDGFTINNTTADATAREIIYLAMGSNVTYRSNTLPLLGVG
jgi:hypothetical protein